MSLKILLTLCYIVYMPKKLTQQEAEQRLFNAHGNEYIYPKFSYVNSQQIINIKCKIHGFFNQKFGSHVYGKRGCAECYGNEIITTTSFIEKAKIIHGNKYDYSFVKYLSAFSKINIKCYLHGIFEQRPSDHIASKAGCPYCANKITTTLFIKRAEIIHNYKYTYENTSYISFDKYVDITCRIHGAFLAKAKIHLSGGGICDKCRKRRPSLPFLNFIERAKKVHKNKYDYSLVSENYRTTDSIVKIKCKYHGVFEQLVWSHLIGKGCSMCGTYVSKGETNWLNSLLIPQEYRQRTIMIGERKIKVDAYDPTTNTIYEFYGDYWHGNPNVFSANQINTRASGKTMQELYDRTIDKEQLIKSAGYSLISIWESDWKSTLNSEQL